MTGGVTRRVDGLAVYDQAGQGPTLVCIHGSMDRGAAFGRVLRQRPDQRAIRYDRRGYGRSVSAGVAAGMRGHVDDLLAVLDGEHDPVVLVGHSYGAVVALVAADVAPERVVGVLAYEPPTSWRPWWPKDSAAGTHALLAAERGGPEAGAEEFMRQVVTSAVWEGLPEATKADRRAEGGALLDDIVAIRSCTEPPFSSPLRRPTIMVCGSASDEAHTLGATELAVAAGTELRVIDGAGHAGLATHADAVSALIDEVAALGAAHPMVDRSSLPPSLPPAPEPH